jgi:alpha-beta hydrolase superfamily lysophospholipase
VVSQVATPRPAPRVPVAMGANFLKDAIQRVREGQGSEIDGGFSFRSKIDQWSTQRNRDVRPGQTLDQIRPTTAVLFVPAEKDELTQGAAGAIEAAKFLSGRGVPSQAIVLPGLSHFQAYSYAGFEVGSNLAADWFLKYLGSASAITADTSAPSSAPVGPRPSPAPMPAGVTTREITFFSEGVKSHGKLFLPPGFSATSNAAAVVVAPDRGETAASVEAQAGAIAGKGMVAMAIDYRGWGKSGAFIYLADPVRWDDRLRFSQHTASVRLRRKRLIPEAQAIDIRNAITYIQGEPGVDATRIGVAGAGLAAAHVINVAANDARVKAGAALQAVEAGKGTERRSFAPSAAHQAAMIKLARSGSAPATEPAAAAMNSEESRLALAEYQPFRSIDQIPKDTPMLYLDGKSDPLAATADFLAKALARP